VRLGERGGAHTPHTRTHTLPPGNCYPKPHASTNHPPTHPTKRRQIVNTATATVLGGGGSPVTATADPPVQITVTCPQKEAVVVVNPQETTNVANLNVAVGGFQTFTAGEHAWTVEKSVDDDTVSLAIGQLPKKITYTLKVTKQPVNNNKFFVFGRITVTNPGTKPVDVSSVSVTAGSAAVPAVCPADSKQVQPNVPLVCTFNVTWNNGAQSGALGARVDTPETSFYGQPATFDFTNPQKGGTKGLTVDVFDELVGKAPANATGVPTKWWSPDESAPPSRAEGIPLTTVDSREYVYSVQVGPFADKGACGTYTLVNTATVVPTDASASAVNATSTVSVSVTGCKDGEVLLEVGKGDLQLAVSGIATAKVTSNTWALAGSAAPPAVEVAPGATAAATFTAAVAKVPTARYQVTGTVTVKNTNAAKAVQVSRITVSVEARNGTAETVDATCGPQGTSFKIATGGNIPCTFNVTVDSASPGDVIAVATDGDGKQSESQPEPVSFDGAKAQAAANAPSCAMVTSVRVTFFHL
jgi:hypothetical protein